MTKDYSEYIGQQFGDLTILSISEPIKELKYQRRCKCKCSCGKEIETNLRGVIGSGNTKSCGHTRFRARKDYLEYIGKQFGELTILSISERDTKRNLYRYCTCKCSCGKEVITRVHNVLSGRSMSCGHIAIEKMIESRNQNPNCRIDNKSTGIKNISFNKRSNMYVVRIERKGVKYQERTYSLEEAIKIKERILQELGELD